MIVQLLISFKVEVEETAMGVSKIKDLQKK
jgi:hypothetical protein